MRTVIIGKESNLSTALNRGLPNCHLLSARELSKAITILDKYRDEKTTFIFNQFQPATRLNDLSSATDYIERAIVLTATILDHIIKNQFDISKIIYTSSSSVYGNNNYCSENDLIMPLNLHASLKLANEELIKKFCHDHGVDFTITRIFNMYGGEDRFSIISKLMSCYKEAKVLPVINHGNAIRDFIHLSDVVKTYRHLIELKNTPLLNIGSGQGTSIKNILDFLRNHGIEVQTENILREELKISTADTTLLRSIFGEEQFIKVEDYVLSMLKAMPEL